MLLSRTFNFVLSIPRIEWIPDNYNLNVEKFRKSLLISIAVCNYKVQYNTVVKYCCVLMNAFCSGCNFYVANYRNYRSISELTKRKITLCERHNVNIKLYKKITVIYHLKIFYRIWKHCLPLTICDRCSMELIKNT